MLTDKEFELLSLADKKRYLKGVKQARGRDDLIYLAKEVLGYVDVEASVHGRLASVLRGNKKRKLVLLPRGSFKSSLVRSWAIQKMLLNPDIRILWDSEVLDNSVTNVAKIKEHLRSPEFVGVYGRLIDTNKRETAREFTIRTRKDITHKEATVVATGIGTVNVGPHYDLIICDDLHSEKNVSTKDQIDKVIAHYRLLLSLLDPGGELVIIGTRWHFADLYNFLLEEEGIEESESWEIYIEKAIRKDGSLFFPNRLTKEFLEEQRKAQGAYLFSVLYMNEPVSGESQVFRREDFRYWGDSTDLYPMQDGKRILLNLYIIIDRAFSSKGTADYTGCILAGVSCSGSIYVIEAVRKKCGLQELFGLIVEWGKKYGWGHIKKVGVETINFEELESFFREQMGKQNTFFILERLMPQGKMSKQDRIEKALQARYANKSVYHKKRMIELEDELLRFPVGAHDDLIDALAYIVSLMSVPGDPSQERDDIQYIPSGLFGRTGY